MTKSFTPKVAAKKARNTKRKPASKVTSDKARDSHRKPTAKVAAKELLDTDRKAASKVFAEKVRDTRRKTAAQFEELVRGKQVGDSMADKSVAEKRELYEGSKDVFQAVLESWEKSFGAAGQGVVALNRAIINITQRNLKTGFDLATSLAGAKNLAEVVELQAAYWRKQMRRSP
jgi:hypothetical protein